MSRVPRIVVLGSSTIGKSSLIAAVLGQTVDLEEYDPTKRVVAVRTNTSIPSLSPAGKPSGGSYFQDFEIVDTPGKVAFAASAQNDLREACKGEPIDGVLLCFALNDPQSFDEVERIWAPVVQALGVPSVLCGNKIDLQQEDKEDGDGAKDKKVDPEEQDTFIQDRELGVQITPSQGAALAEKLGCVSYVECSAVTRVGLDNAIQTIVREAIIRISAEMAEEKRAEEAKLLAEKEAEEKTRAEHEAFQALGVPTVVVVGPQAAGKTSFINALFGDKWNSRYVPGGSVLSRKMPIRSRYYDKVQFVEIPESVPDAHSLIQQIAKQSPNCFYFVCVPVIETRAFARHARFFTELVREADAPGHTVIIGTKVDLLQIEVGEGDDCRTVPYFAGIDHATGERVARNVSAQGYIECSAVSMFGIKNAMDELLPQVITPRTAGQNVRGVLRSAGMLFGWLANSIVNSTVADDEESFDGEEDEEFMKAAVGERDESVVGDFSNDRRIHVFICGERGSGKTTLLRRYLKQPFVAEPPQGYTGTLRFDMRGRPYAPQNYEIVVWDCETLMPVFPDNHSKSAVVFVIDATRPNAIREIRALHREMELQYGTLFCGRVIVLTHTDKEIAINEEQLAKFADDLNCTRVIRTGGPETDKEPITNNPIQIAVRQLLKRHHII